MLPLLHQRSESTQEYLRYSGQISADVMNDENFSYYISVQTPYSSVGAGGGLVTVPVNAYDDGIILKSKSPSCGVSGRLGVTAALCKQHHFDLVEF